MTDAWSNTVANQNTPGSTLDPSDSAYKPRTGTLGTGSKYNAGKYDVGVHQFPSDLFSNRGQYGGNWVTFYINVSSGSKLIKDKLVTTTTNDTPSMRNNVNASGTTVITKNQMIGAVAASGVVAGALTGDAGNAVKGGVIGAVAGAAVAISGMNQMRRITDTIALTVPNNFSARYNVSYIDEGTAQQANLVGVGAEVVSALKSKSISGLTKAATAAVDAIATPLALSTGAAGGDFMSKAAGLAANPKKEQIFKGVDFRTFSFEYTFAPRNEKESKEIADIIRLFKLHMHPEFKDSHGFLFIYPSEFDIYYYHGETENMNLPRHTSCVLTDCNVNYTPNNQFSTFASANGTPGGAATQIQLSLTFKELAILTKDQILDGF
jgi:hypothetical protein